jgi:DNA ligase-1
MKAMLASDVVLEKVKYPVFIQPKIDGVRALHQGSLTGRSLEPFANEYVCEFFDFAGYKGIDGEMAAGLETRSDLCRLTTSALSTIEGSPWMLWHAFDYIGAEALHLPYHKRHGMLYDLLKSLPAQYAEHVRLVPTKIAQNEEQLLQIHAGHMNAGYEGSIIRDPDGMHKAGRSTVREGGLLRIKDFMDSEAVVIGITEGESNGNAATIDARGHTKRSSHKENMTPNGQVGSLQCMIINDIMHPLTGKLLFSKNLKFTLANGKMTVEEATDFFNNPSKIIGKIVKFQHMPHGVKEMPRIATFQCIRMPADM